MSVLDLLAMEGEAALREIERLKLELADGERRVDNQRLHLAEMEVRVVELRAAAGILQAANLRVERRPDGMHVEIDPPKVEP